MKKTLFIIVSIFILASVSSAKQNDTLEKVIDNIQNKYESIETFHADFVQEAEVKVLETVERAHGEVWFKKPGNMRWDYHRPTKDKIVSNGDTIWYYNEAEKQVVESSYDNLKGESNSTTLLSGLANIKELFNYKFATIENKKPETNDLIELSPKDSSEEGTFDQIIISVNKSNSLVDKIYLYDPFGNLTTISLRNFELNKTIKKSVFHFKPPRGSEVVKIPDSRK